jgi:hypothetical protein
VKGWKSSLDEYKSEQVLDSRDSLRLEEPHLVHVSVSDMVLLNKDLIGRMNGSSYIGSKLSLFLLERKEEELQKENQ